MEEFQIWSIWSSNRIGTSLMGIGTILGVWLSMRIAVASRNSDESNLFSKIVSSAFGLIILSAAWINFTMGVNTMISSAVALTQLKETSGTISTVAEGYIDYIGTTDPVTMPLPLGISFIVVSGIIILGQIWIPKK
jgi:hypothetical protein|tara:strand:+ start:44 stop:451 length:408 start_codon:yes stop_codon:yes gene_type:complete